MEAGRGYSLPLLLLAQESEAMGAEAGQGLLLPLAVWCRWLALFMMRERGPKSSGGRRTTTPPLMSQSARAVTAVVVTAAEAAEEADGSAPRTCLAGTIAFAACSATAAGTRGPMWAECAGRIWGEGLSGEEKG